MKAQTQALTAILITIVTVGAIASAYVWGTPLLEKQQSRSELEGYEQDIINMRDSAVSTVRSGEGSVERVTLEADNSEISVNETGDSVGISFSSVESSLGNSWVTLEQESLRNVSIGAGAYALKSGSSPAVVLTRSQGNNVEYRIEFRNLRSGNTIETVDIEVAGRDISGGETTVVFENSGTRTGEIQIAGTTFEKETTDLRVALR